MLLVLGDPQALSRLPKRLAVVLVETFVCRGEPDEPSYRSEGSGKKRDSKIYIQDKVISRLSIVGGG